MLGSTATATLAGKVQGVVVQTKRYSFSFELARPELACSEPAEPAEWVNFNFTYTDGSSVKL